MSFLSALIPMATSLFSLAKKGTKSDFGSSMLSSVGQGLGSRVSGYLGNKIFGVPTPGAPTGQELGNSQKAYMDAAYPGTTAWERLGVSPAAVAGTASEDMSNKNAQSMQNKMLSFQGMLEDKKNRASIISSLGSLGIGGIQAGLNAYKGKDMTNFDTQISLTKQRLQSEMPNIEADTINKLVDAELKKAMTKTEGNRSEIIEYENQIKEIRAETELTAKEMDALIGNVQGIISSLIIGFGISKQGKFGKKKYYPTSVGGYYQNQ